MKTTGTLFTATTAGIALTAILVFATTEKSIGKHAHITTENVEHLCEGILPENDLNIPISKSNKGMSEAEFHEVINNLEKLYRPEIEAVGEKLKINRDWASGTVNASATKSGNTRTLNFYGGLARHPEVKKDGFALVACHEMGHHLGGIPKVKSLFTSWAANEGQSDYFSTLKCLRRYYETFDQERVVEIEDEYAGKACLDTYSDSADQQVCLKLMKAGKEVSLFFQTAKKESRVPKFNEPDTTVVRTTNDSHPATQCRMDTYFQGALCPKDWEDKVSDSDAFQGACHPDQFANGVRPRCWYKY